MILFSIGVVALSVVLYGLLDGFDLGVGMLSALTRDQTRRRSMQDAVAPIWDGAEVWLIAACVLLWGALPAVLGVLLAALHAPLLVMTAALIVRSVGFQCRRSAAGSGGLADIGFAGGSLVAAFMQGAMLGDLVQGLPIVDGRFVGDDLGWLTPFPLLCGVGLCLGYALLGAVWLAHKGRGEVRRSAERQVPVLSAALLAVLSAVSICVLSQHPQVIGRWLERPYLLALPVLSVIALLKLATGVGRQPDRPPALTIGLILLAAIGVLAVSIGPYLIPFAVTLDDAAAQPTNLAFMVWGEGLVVLPLMLFNAAAAWRAVRERLRPGTSILQSNRATHPQPCPGAAGMQGA